VISIWRGRTRVSELVRKDIEHQYCRMPTKVTGHVMETMFSAEHSITGGQTLYFYPMEQPWSESKS
jgi:hypothetical protein